jgi:tetratricopeptide (TPR) repeat protein
MVAAVPIDAQTLPLRRSPVSERPAPRCPAPARATPPSAADRDRARRLTTLGHEAALTGDTRAARDLFLQAAHLNPTAEDVAYHLGRAYEALGARADAVRQYCRYLALAPSGADAADVTERIGQLAPAVALPDQAAAQFRAGLDHFDRRRYREAQRAFTSALVSAPEWDAAYYNRALAYAADRQPERAVRDLEKYLELVPETRDRPSIVRQIAALRRQALVPSAALTRGLLLPGLGQHYTRRPVLGVIILGAVGGAAYYASRPERRQRTEIRTFVPPFGEPYADTVTWQQTAYPNVVPGVAAAVGISLAGAAEAYLYARRQRTAPRTREPVSAARGRSGALANPRVLVSPIQARVGLELRFGGP